MTKTIISNKEGIASEKISVLLDQLSEELRAVSNKKASSDQIALIAIELGKLQGMLLSSLEDDDIGHYWVSLFWALCDRIENECSITALRKVKSGNSRVTPFQFNLECQRAGLPIVDFVQLSRALVNLSSEISTHYPALNGTFSIRRNPYYQHRFDFSWLKERTDE
jgi:hypothetical protein